MRILNLSRNIYLYRKFFCTSKKHVLENVTFFGGDTFAVSILTGLNELVKKNLIKNLNVITCDNSEQQQSSKNIMKNHVIDYCKENNIEFHDWVNVKKSFEHEKTLVNRDLALVASFAYLIPSKLINMYK